MDKKKRGLGHGCGSWINKNGIISSSANGINIIFIFRPFKVDRGPLLVSTSVNTPSRHRHEVSVGERERENDPCRRMGQCLPQVGQ